MGYYLARLPSHTRIAVRFRDPKDGHKGDPFGEIFKTTTCQSVMVAWVLTFAWEHIKHMRFGVSGCIRTAQKNEWNEYFARERNNGVHERDNEAALKAIFDLSTKYLCVYPRLEEFNEHQLIELKALSLAYVAHYASSIQQTFGTRKITVIIPRVRTLFVIPARTFFTN